MISAFDLFCGAGGLSLGFQDKNKYKTLVANDKDKSSIATYSENHPNVPSECCDIKLFHPEKYLNGGKDPLIVIGGPPCQSYSTLGKRKIDSRALMYKEYFRVIEKVKPFLFLYENVTGVLSMGENIFEDLVSSFKNIGYSIQFQTLNAVDYGVPQVRKRVIIIGSRKEAAFPFPAPIADPHVTLRQAISDLPSIVSGESCSSYNEIQSSYQREMRAGCSFLDLHIAAKHNQNLVDMISRITDEGGTAHELKEEPRPTSGYGNTYARLWWDKPSTTITGNLGTPSSSRCIHPVDNRGLTSREGARIQSFPDSYKFCGSRSEINQQIGNAVPPILGYFLSSQIYEYVKKEY